MGDTTTLPGGSSPAAGATFCTYTTARSRSSCSASFSRRRRSGVSAAAQSPSAAHCRGREGQGDEQVAGCWQGKCDAEPSTCTHATAALCGLRHGSCLLLLHTLLGVVQTPVTCNQQHLLTRASASRALPSAGPMQATAAPSCSTARCASASCAYAANVCHRAATAGKRSSRAAWRRRERGCVCSRCWLGSPSQCTVPQQGKEDPGARGCARRNLGQLNTNF